MTRLLTYLLLCTFTFFNCNKPPASLFQQFEFYYNNTWTSAYSLKLTGSDTVFIRQLFASNRYEKKDTSTRSNTSYFGILSPTEKMKLDSFIRHLDFAKYDSSYGNNLAEDGVTMRYFIEKDSVTKKIDVAGAFAPAELLALGTWIAETKENLKLTRIDSTITFKDFTNPELPIAQLDTQRFIPPQAFLATSSSGNHSVVIEPNVNAIAKSKIQSKENRYFSSFTTELNAEWYKEGKLADVVKDENYSFMSWYSEHNDTIDLVAHIGVLETEALLLRFFGDTVVVRVYRCGHTPDRKIFKLRPNDPLSQCIQVPTSSCKLLLSEVPDTIDKPVIHGFVDLKSNDYYDEHTKNEPERCSINMRFYFRSQFRRFDFD